MNIFKPITFLILSSVLLYASDQKRVGVTFSLAAKGQIGQTVSYNPAYQKIAYPNGDVAIKEGVCTDVIVRAFRKAFGIDLQKLLNQDMKKSFKHYPKLWGLTKPDSNIDHRRVQNLMCFFKDHGMQTQDSKYTSGDIVVWDLGSGILHIGIVSNSSGSFLKRLLNSSVDNPLVVHNIACGVQEEDILYDYKIVAHYRINDQLIKILKILSADSASRC